MASNNQMFLAIILIILALVGPCAAHEHGTPWRIMVLGDSISGGCYPPLLWQKLTDAKLGIFEFVGSRKGPKCGVSGYLGRTESHGGYSVRSVLKIAGQNELTTNGAFNDSRDLKLWFANVFDILLMHIGSTAAYGGRPRVPLIMQAYSAIVKAARDRNPRAIILIAQLIPLATPHANVRPINQAIPEWASGESTRQSPIVVVDMFNGFAPKTMTDDNIHPNKRGSEWMAQKWFDTLVPILKQATAH